MVFLEPSEAWGSGGCRHARTGGQKRKQSEDRPLAFSCSPLLACPYCSVAEPDPRLSGRAPLPPSDALVRGQPPGAQSRQEKDSGWTWFGM